MTAAPETPQIESPNVPPPFAARLDPGDYLLEVGFSGPASLDVVSDGLERVGFADLIFDQTAVDDPKEWGLGDAPPSGSLLQRTRLVGRLTRSIRILDVHEDGETRLSWLYARRLQIDPFRGLRFDNVKAHRLFSNRLYELRFASRVPRPAQPTRLYAARLLQTMGFVPEKLSLVKKNMRFPGISGAEGTDWIAFARWTRGDGYVLECDDLFFDEARLVGPPPDVVPGEASGAA